MSLGKYVCSLDVEELNVSSDFDLCMQDAGDICLRSLNLPVQFEKKEGKKKAKLVCSEIFLCIIAYKWACMVAMLFPVQSLLSCMNCPK